ncbi:hypothetical protein B2J88_28325 [Rhodococcus sp. SRB_17]|nr:hypothetical protein [Rhodococcus sp. SRB_17]
MWWKLRPDVLTVIRDHEQFRFDYRTHTGSEIRRAAEPHRLIHTARHWYLVGWDVDQEDWRTFRVDRLLPRFPTDIASPRATHRMWTWAGWFHTGSAPDGIAIRRGSPSMYPRRSQ